MTEKGEKQQKRAKGSTEEFVKIVGLCFKKFPSCHIYKEYLESTDFLLWFDRIKISYPSLQSPLLGSIIYLSERFEVGDDFKEVKFDYF